MLNASGKILEDVIRGDWSIRLGHLCWIIGDDLTQAHTPYREQEIGILSFLIIMFQRDGFQALEKGLYGF